MNFALFHFIRPYWLLAFIALALIVGLTLKHKLQRGSWTKVCDEELLPYILQQKPTQKERVSLISINVIASALAILALAGPTWEREPSPAFRNDYGVVIALDLSVSMEATDIKPSRLIRARYKIADILKKRKDGQTALLVYDGDAFTVTPLTSDNATIASQLEALTPDIMPSEGNNTVLAVEKAVDLLKQAGLQKGQVFLVTDSFYADDKAKVVESLGGYQLSVLAVGTAEGAPISLPDGGFLKDETGAMVMPKLPIAALKKLASDAGGIYQTISDTDSDVDHLLAAVDSSVQKAQNNPQDEELLLQTWKEKGVWLLLMVLPLAALSFRRGFLVVGFLLLIPFPKNSYALEWQDLWQTKDQQAMLAYKQKDYDKAAQLFEDPAWQAAALYKARQANVKQLKTPTDAIGFYNQGNVFAKLGQTTNKTEAKIDNFNKAVKAYKQALELEPDEQLAADAKFNKNLVEAELKKLKQQQKQQQQEQQKSQQSSSESKQQQSKKQQQKNQQNQDSQDNKDNKDNSEQQQQQQQTAQAKNSQDNKDNKSENQQPQPAQSQGQNGQNQQPEQNQDKKPPRKPEQNDEYRKAQDDEKNRANETTLNSIPDDPAGLLRRKFKYQYGQRQENPNGSTW